MTLSKTIKAPPPERIGRTSLATMLLFWGVIEAKTHRKEIPHSPIGSRQRGPGAICLASEGQLWDWHEAVKATWRERITKAHPDNGGRHEEAALLNRAWDRTKDLFGRLGIGESAL